MTRTFRGALVGAVLLLLASIAPVAAHAELVESDPAEGETIATPYTLTATFSEELLDGSMIVVRDAAGDEVVRGGADPDDRTMMVVELPELPAGSYVAGWTARTADGHTERGTIDFDIAATPTPSPTATPNAPSTPTPSASAGGTIAPAPTPSPTPTPTPAAAPPRDAGGSAAGGDVLLALGIAAVALLALGAFLFSRSRS